VRIKIALPILMGEAPAKSMPAGAPPFSSQSGRRLRELLGVEDLATRFELRNLLESWPGESGKGDSFPAKYASHRAFDVVPEFHHRVVIFAGKRVAKAFGKSKMKYFEPDLTRVWDEEGGRISGLSAEYIACVVPHPSGVNRWYNDVGNRAQARRFFDELERSIKEWNA
jgi:uracil-DNA glycosylase